MPFIRGSLSGRNGAPQKLLDMLQGGAVAYSTRKLRNGYAGPCMNVRRSSDSATQDIGFDGTGWLDQCQLMQFVGAGNSAFVATWYDQTGNGRHATQATTGTQPRIVNAGTVDTQNNKPSVFFSGSTYMRCDNFTGAIPQAAICVSWIGNIDATIGTFGRLLAVYTSGDANDFNGTTSAQLMGMNSSTTSMGFFNTSAITITNSTLFQLSITGSSNNTIYVNTVSKGGGTRVVGWSGCDHFNLGCAVTAANTYAASFKGYMSEIVLFNRTLPKDGSNLRLDFNQCRAFGITTG